MNESTELQMESLKGCGTQCFHIWSCKGMLPNLLNEKTIAAVFVKKPNSQVLSQTA